MSPVNRRGYVLTDEQLRQLLINDGAVARASERSPLATARSTARGSQRRPTGAADEAAEV
ncbi:hypothetical protein BN903_207 [Halorubrum sp. AJ67]|nr:hypothetical protein BN903_207 [Halorubrum sp. AJ67]